MHITGIIAEYNPFHNGHKFQIEQIRKKHPDTVVAAVMSGSFLQRGTAALLDKWTRAELAVQGGCDAVFELPFSFACRSAQDFARGGVQLLNRLGIVNTLAFGAETSDPETLQAIAAAIDTPSIQEKLHHRIGNGASYATALTAILHDEGKASAGLLHQPNNILAIEYLRALKHYAPSISPLLIPRQGSGYHDRSLAHDNASASAIRKVLYEAGQAAQNSGGLLLLPQLANHQSQLLSQALPPATRLTIKSLTAGSLPDSDALLLPLRTLLLRTNTASLQQIYGIDEGLENRIERFAATAADFCGLSANLSTKRYPISRMTRTLIWLLLGLTKQQVRIADEQGPLYARLLAVSSRGRSLLSAVKQSGQIPLITKTAAYLTSKQRNLAPEMLSPLQQQLRYDTLATELRQLTIAAPIHCRNDFQQSPRFF